MSDHNTHRSSLKKRCSFGPDNTEALVILRRKGSVDPCGDPGTLDGSNRHSDRVSKVVESVSCDVMSGEPIRMMGYMEKRSKLLGWKKFWFVLDGHLLTYFKSKADYETLSPFVGSITLGNVSTVRPIQIKHCKGFPMQIVSRNQVYCLRCPEKSVLEEWVLALQETISIPPSISSPVWADPGVQFYRYSFAAVSDWSVADSQGDISGSLSNLPKNFYLKRDKSEQYLPPLKQKCQSFTNLPTDTSFPLPDSPTASTRSISSAMSGRTDPKMRYSTSLIQLESSVQASELKRELASKLSIGHISPSSIRCSGKEHLDKLRQKFHDDDNLKNTIISPNTFGDCRENEPEDVRPNTEIVLKSESLSATSRGAGAEVPRATSTLAVIAEGFEPNLKRRPHTLQLHSSDSEEMKSLKKKRGISTLFQRIFKKETDQSPTRTKHSDRTMVISSPVDLRAQVQKVEPNNTPAPDPSSPTKAKLSNSPSAPNIEYPLPSKGISIPKRNSLIYELRDVQRRRKSSETESSPPATENSSPVPPPPPPKLTDDSLSYHEKLAKFNRLSAQLASISPLSSPSSGGAITRSTSCRVKSIHDDDEPPPLLPPKKTTSNNKYPSAYDTPMNNRPITGGTPEEQPPDNSMTFGYPGPLEPRERKISLRELLCKKNSAPEITLGTDDLRKLESDVRHSAEVREVLSSEVIGHLEQKREPMRSNSEMESTIDATCSNISNILGDSNSELRMDEQYYSSVPLEISEAIYEEIKYATQETIIKELETVQEYADESEELYDEFVTEMTTYGASTDGDPSSCTTSIHNYDYTSSVRFSGMAALQEYLDEEAKNNTDTSLKTQLPSDTGEAALNRLGRSLAVHKLESLLK